MMYSFSVEPERSRALIKLKSSCSVKGAISAGVILKQKAGSSLSCPSKRRTLKPLSILEDLGCVFCSTRADESVFGFWCVSSQRSVVGASHGEQPLQGVSGVRVLHGALCLEVVDQQGNGLQQLLFRKLREDRKKTSVTHLLPPLNPASSDRGSHLTPEDHHVLDGVRLEDWELVHCNNTGCSR